MNAYQELLFKHGYEAASLFAYLQGMADKEGKYECSLRGLSKVSGLSVQQVRTLLLCYQSTHLITQLSTHLSTQITICKRGCCRGFKNTYQHTSQHTQQHTKESPPSPPLDVSPHTPLLNPPYNPPKESTIHQSACERFEAWLSEHCPYIRKHYKMMTEAELGKLKQQYGAELIAETCSDIENRIDLRKRYSHLYRTLLNWLKKRNEDNRTINPTTREERITQAAQLVKRMGEEANRPIQGLDDIFA